ncbi:MAG: hypothetical protein ACPGLV_01495 [Bacteroidia bacterium]
MSALSLLLTINLSAQLFISNPDSIQYAITDTEIDTGKYFNVVFRYDDGIDSIKWNIWELGWSYTVVNYDSSGVVLSQNIENKHIISKNYKLYPTKAGTFNLPSAILWSQGEGKELLFNDTLIVREPKNYGSANVPKSNLFKDFNFSPKVELNFDCPTDQVCTKAYFTDTSFTAGDTVTLVIGANKLAKFQIPSIKNMKYITHSTSINTSIKEGLTKRFSYITVKYSIEKNINKIKTPTFKAKIGARTQYIRKLKIKKPKS